ncbi:hypothetical protein PG987_012927 [Apiospora arundinis]
MYGCGARSPEAPMTRPAVAAISIGDTVHWPKWGRGADAFCKLGMMEECVSVIVAKAQLQPFPLVSNGCGAV